MGVSRISKARNKVRRMEELITQWDGLIDMLSYYSSNPEWYENNPVELAVKWPEISPVVPPPVRLRFANTSLPRLMEFLKQELELTETELAKEVGGQDD